MKKILTLLSTCLLLGLSVTSCTSSSDNESSNVSSDSSLVESSILEESSSLPEPKKVQANEFSKASPVQCGNFTLMIPDSWTSDEEPSESALDYYTSNDVASISISASVLDDVSAVDDTYLSNFTDQLIDSFVKDSEYGDFTVTEGPSKMSVSGLDAARVVTFSFFNQQSYNAIMYIGGYQNNFISLFAIIPESSKYMHDDDCKRVFKSITYLSDSLEGETSSQDSENEDAQASIDDTAVPAEYRSALAKAKSYDKSSHMSKERLYHQLTSEYGEKFSAEAAQYAIDNIDADWNKNALITAQNYSDRQHMSKARLYHQLTSEYGEKFTDEEAQYAVDNVQADWKENALEMAKSYQENMDMSPAAIWDQLVSEYGEQFTEEEADYAIANLPQ